MYRALRPLLFALPPEISHDLSLDFLGAAERLNILKLFVSDPVVDPVKVMGIEFPNRVGLAAGLDKNGDYFNAMGQLGFGFVEVGTVTPKPQPGNAKPRMFRLAVADAIINRMGFNNKGVDHLTDQVKNRRFQGVLGINIGKNLFTSVESAVDDYMTCLQAVYDQADYVTVNISSPNTPGLRDLQYGDQLTELLSRLKAEQQRLAEIHHRYVPLAVKIAPDMDDENIQQCAEIFLQTKIDGLVATNTTTARDAVTGLEHADEQGGLSGAPVLNASNDLIRQLAASLKGQIPIIGVGGILKPEDALAKIDAGASLVQIYTGLIYKGPRLVRDTAKALAAQQS